MKFTRKRKGFLRETAAASDLAFLLIIYFLVIAGFNVNVGFLVDLPREQEVYILSYDDLMRFDMDNSGNIFLRGDVLSIGAADQIIRAALIENANLAILLFIEPQAPWQEVVLFVELAQSAAVVNFSFNVNTLSSAAILEET
ncbi:MAG: biopolymer transporter ExbD [Treponema sp.]|jgi:biopolymer transport protein ExbD|nr:biopolymer transporter ExbD [Treponema sp.]